MPFFSLIQWRPQKPVRLMDNYTQTNLTVSVNYVALGEPEKHNMF
jgi:hypothetical protein